MTIPGLPWRRMPKGITARIIALSWLITLSTLGIFVLAIVPGQKKDLANALESKARGIASALQDVTAGAAVSADYSSVVEQCLQVLAGDASIDYLVIAKNDGFSLIVDKKGWRTETLGSFWHPEERAFTGGIATVPLFGKRVFEAAKPFDYSGLAWGWIHVGLSLDAYDKSVATVYERTLLLVILCSALSLALSVRYARRLVLPILALRTVVLRVAKGDFSARADIRTGDEVESLAHSFNAMADSILQRDRILESVRFGAQRFLSAEDWRTVIDEVLASIGAAAQTWNAFVFEGRPGPDGSLAGECRHGWLAAADPRAPGGHGGRGPTRIGREPAERLCRGEVAGLESEDPDQMGSSILIPVFAGDAFFGVLGFRDGKRGRGWSDAERDSFRTVAGMLGSAIGRRQAEDALVEAKETLEERVRERTRELQDQVDAKERAHAALAEAQQRLIALSRASGMAEVATGVLHNVGNVLNSVNVSATLVADKVRESRVDNLVALIGMLDQHADDLPDFISRDPKGSRVVPYLGKLGRHLQEERKVMLSELQLLTDHIGHIKQIVSTQQNYAKVSGLIEDVALPALVEDALRILESSIARHEIVVERDFEQAPPVLADKHLILQIVLNLLRNAIQAIKESGKAEGAIRIRIRRHGEDRIQLSVEDSGVGLPPENLTRIFAHGFTTKKDGHGFGLHSGALAARQMGGILRAESPGPGLGATFTLELPLAGAPGTKKARTA